MPPKRFIYLFLSMLPAVLAYVYFSVISPFGVDGSVNNIAVLGATFLILVALVPLLRLIFMLMMPSNLSNKLAFVTSLMALEILLINSLGLVQPGSLVLIVISNLVVFWYLSVNFNKG